MRRALLLALLLATPLALAHGELEASELEVELLKDEASDAMEATGGYDVTALYLGEAHDPEMGFGAAGDALYFRTDLYGDPTRAAPTDLPYKVTFTFDTPVGPLTRFLQTSDGAVFTGDFDKIVVDVSDDGVAHIQRAMILTAGLGLAPGDVIGGFLVESFAGGSLRDRAPGGMFAPGLAGAVELPGESTVVQDSHTLAGPVNYVALQVERVGKDTYTITTTSLLKKGSQHIMLGVQDAPGWAISFEGPSSASVTPGGVATFRVKASATGVAAGPAPLAVLTDVGGRGEILYDGADLRAAGGSGAPIDEADDTARPVPGPALAAPLGLIAAAMFVAWRRR